MVPLSMVVALLVNLATVKHSTGNGDRLLAPILPPLFTTKPLIVPS